MNVLYTFDKDVSKIMFSLSETIWELFLCFFLNEHIVKHCHLLNFNHLVGPATVHDAAGGVHGDAVVAAAVNTTV